MPLEVSSSGIVRAGPIKQIEERVRVSDPDLHLHAYVVWELVHSAAVELEPAAAEN